MVEPLLSGIVLGMITVTGFGLFVAAFLQYFSDICITSDISGSYKIFLKRYPSNISYKPKVDH